MSFKKNQNAYKIIVHRDMAQVNHMNRIQREKGDRLPHAVKRLMYVFYFNTEL